MATRTVDQLRPRADWHSTYVYAENVLRTRIVSAVIATSFAMLQVHAPRGGVEAF